MGKWFKRNDTGVGEPFVWLTSLGVSIGLLMIFGMLGLILWRGVVVFWPKRILQIQVKENSDAVFQGAATYGGVLIHKREKVGRELDEHGRLAPPEREWQIFLGNKDIYGSTFHYLDVKDIVDTRSPEGVMQIERMEYGDLIGLPVGLKLADGQEIAEGDAGFQAKLAGLVDEVNERRSTIRHIEKSQIGRINKALERLALAEAKLKKQPDTADPTDALARIEEQRARLHDQYADLAAKARALRDRQEEHHFVYRLLSDDTEHTLPVGQIVNFWYPNRMTAWERFGLMAHKFWSFVSQEPREANTEGGIFPAIFGTLVMTVIMSLMVTPFGVVAAVYLREYARQGPVVRMVRIAINNLAGVPSIVFGVFGLGFFVYKMGGLVDRTFFAERLPNNPTFGTGGVLWASLTLALLTVPVVIVAAEEALSAVPRGAREGALACGASRWQTIARVVLPASAPGILTGIILAMARGAGEVAPLMLVGVVKLAPTLPINATYPYLHLDQKFMHLGFHIYDLGFQSPDSEAAKPMVFATTLLLIGLVVLMNLAAIIIRERLRRKYATGAF